MSVSQAEVAVCRALRLVVEGVAPGESLDQAADEFRDLCSALEFYLPAVLKEHDPFWRGESLDAFQIPVALKSGRLAAELVGLCLLVSDQSWTPFDLSIRISASADQVEALSLRLGERVAGTGQLLRIPYGSPGVGRLGRRVVERRGQIDWAFVVSFGDEDVRPARG